MNTQQSRRTDGGFGMIARRWLVVALIAIALLSLLAVVLSSLEPRLYVECKAGARPSRDPTDYDSQIVIIGPERAVTTISETVDISLTALRTCAVGYRGLGTIRAESLPYSPSDLRHLTMGLYELDSEQDLEGALKEINKAGLADHVYAHPNYLVGLLGQSSCGNPWEVVGSPWEVVGSPWEVVGSPWEVVGSPGGNPLPAEDAAKLFWNQWAFQQIGAGPYFTHTLESTVSTAAGESVRVGVLDTSPFHEPPATQPTATPTPTGVVWVGSTQKPAWWNQSYEETELALTIYETELPDLTADPKAPDVSDHGLFVAGLIHAIAPKSDIRLYRVLDEHGCGQVFFISEAILHFAEEVHADAGSLRGAVINLSLGVHKPRTALQDNGTSSAQQDEGETEAVQERMAQDDIASLRTAVAFATKEQIVIVAAAGNDSYLSSQEGLVLSPHYPAQYPSVIGVSASNAMRQRSCFSNWGDIAAPGGDGGPVSILAKLDPDLLNKNPNLEGLDCVPFSSICSGDCTKALISLVYDPEATATEKYGYAYWQGTSFSAPLVSGAAALLLDASWRTSCPRLSPEQVFEALRCGAPTPDGVINIPASLYRCLP